MVVSLTLSSLSILNRWYDEVETAGNEPGCSGWPAVVSLSHCALDALYNALLEIAFLLVKPVVWFLPRSPPESVFTCLGRQIPGLFTGGLETRPATLYLVQPKRLPGVWPLRMLQLRGATGWVPGGNQNRMGVLKRTQQAPYTEVLLLA